MQIWPKLDVDFNNEWQKTGKIEEEKNKQICFEHAQKARAHEGWSDKTPGLKMSPTPALADSDGSVQIDDRQTNGPLFVRYCIWSSCYPHIYPLGLSYRIHIDSDQLL